MKQKTLRWIVFAVVISLLCCLLGGCSLIKPTIHLEDYLNISAEGLNGSGTIRVSPAYGRMVSDHPQAIDSKHVSMEYGQEMAESAVGLLLEDADPFTFHYPQEEGYSNGDQVLITVELNSKALTRVRHYFKANFKYDSSITYTVEGLADPIEIDPFGEDLLIEGHGVSGRDGKINTYPDFTFKNAAGYTQFIRLNYDVDPDACYENGQMIHLSLDADEEEIRNLEKNHGVHFVRTEADVAVNGIPYYPYENPQEIFDYIDSEGTEDIQTAFYDYLKPLQQDDGKSELVGMMYLLNNQGHEHRDNFARNEDSQLVFFYHMEDGNVEGGYYTYFSSCNDVLIETHKDPDTGKLYKLTLPDCGYWPEYGSSYRRNISGDFWNPPRVSPTFDYNGARYHGQRTLQECVDAFLANQTNGDPYDIVVVDELLRSNGITG